MRIFIMSASLMLALCMLPLADAMLLLSMEPLSMLPAGEASAICAFCASVFAESLEPCEQAVRAATEAAAMKKRLGIRSPFERQVRSERGVSNLSLLSGYSLERPKR